MLYRPSAELLVASSVFSISSTVIILFSLESELSSSKNFSAISRGLLLKKKMAIGYWYLCLT